MSPVEIQHARVLADIRRAAASACALPAPRSPLPAPSRKRAARPPRILPQGTRTARPKDVALTYGIPESSLLALCRRHPKLSTRLPISRRRAGGILLIQIPVLERLLTPA